MLDAGNLFTDVESWIEALDLTEEGKSVLWLYLWSPGRERRFARGEAVAPA